MFLIWPITTELFFNKLQEPKIELSKLTDNELGKYENLISTGWYFKGFYNQEGIIINEPQLMMQDSKRYFNISGKFQQVFYDNSILEGTWSFTQNYDSLIIISFGENITVKIEELTKESFVLSISEARAVHVPYKFNILTYLASYF